MKGATACGVGGWDEATVGRPCWCRGMIAAAKEQPAAAMAFEQLLPLTDGLLMWSLFVIGKRAIKVELFKFQGRPMYPRRVV